MVQVPQTHKSGLRYTLADAKFHDSLKSIITGWVRKPRVVMAT